MPTRSWQEYCSPKCRKEVWLDKQASINHSHPDILRRLARIEAKMGIKP